MKYLYCTVGTDKVTRQVADLVGVIYFREGVTEPSAYLRYCSSLTCSIQSTTLPSGFS